MRDGRKFRLIGKKGYFFGEGRGVGSNKFPINLAFFGSNYLFGLDVDIKCRKVR
jgi:hypothetical protein